MIVCFTFKVSFEALISDTILIKKIKIVQVVFEQGVRDAQHQRNIGVGNDWQPVGVEVRPGIVPDRADADEFHAGFGGLQRVVLLYVPSMSAKFYLCIFQREAAESNKQFGIFNDGRPGRRVHQHDEEIAHHVRDNDLCRGKAVRVDRVGESAKTVQESMKLTRRMMEFSGTCPAVRSGVDCLIAVVGFNSLQSVRDDCFGLFPGN